MSYISMLRWSYSAAYLPLIIFRTLPFALSDTLTNYLREVVCLLDSSRSVKWQPSSYDRPHSKMFLKIL